MRSSFLSMQYLSSSSIFITLTKPDSSEAEPTIVDIVPLPSNSSSGWSSSSNGLDKKIYIVKYILIRYSCKKIEMIEDIRNNYDKKYRATKYAI